MSGHFLKLTLDENGVHGEFLCDEDGDAWCHTSCTIGCEVITDRCRATHPQASLGECQPVLFLEDAGYWYEAYIGADTEPRSGPVDFQWSDDFYVWTYLEEEEAQLNNATNTTDQEESTT